MRRSGLPATSSAQPSAKSCARRPRARRPITRRHRWALLPPHHGRRLLRPPVTRGCARRGAPSQPWGCCRSGWSFGSCALCPETAQPWTVGTEACGTCDMAPRPYRIHLGSIAGRPTRQRTLSQAHPAASLSASEYTATVWMPILRAVAMTRQAISPRLAISIFLNICILHRGEIACVRCAHHAI